MTIIRKIDAINNIPTEILADIIKHLNPKDIAKLKAVCKGGKLRIDQAIERFYFTPRNVIIAISEHSSQWSRDFISLFRTSDQYKSLCEKAAKQPAKMTSTEIVAYALTIENYICGINADALREAAKELVVIIGDGLADNIQTMALAIQYTNRLSTILGAITDSNFSEEDKSLVDAYEDAFKGLEDNRHYINLAGTALPKIIENVCLAYANLNSTILGECNIENSDFTCASFKNANFIDVSMNETCLDGANFSNSKIRDLVITCSQVTDTLFISTKIDRLIFLSSHLSGSNFKGASIIFLDLSGNTLNNVNLMDIRFLHCLDELATIMLPAFCGQNIKFLGEDDVKNPEKLKSKFSALQDHTVVFTYRKLCIAPYLAANIIDVIKELDLDPHVALRIVNAALAHPIFNEENNIIKKTTNNIKHTLAFFGVCKEPDTASLPLIEFKVALEARINKFNRTF